MEDWHIELAKAAGLAFIAFLGGYGTYWLQSRERRQQEDERERQRQAEYDEFKKKRRLIGAGEVERMERADKLTDLIVKLRTHEISHEELEQARAVLIGKRGIRKKQNQQRKVEPGLPDGVRVEYAPNGDRVEYVRIDNEDGTFVEESFITRRNDADVLAQHQKFKDKSFLSFYYTIVVEMADGVRKKPNDWAELEAQAKKIEATYPADELFYNDDVHSAYDAGMESAFIYVHGGRLETFKEWWEEFNDNGETETLSKLQQPPEQPLSADAVKQALRDAIHTVEMKRRIEEGL